jgi:hypothetical protein
MFRKTLCNGALMVLLSSAALAEARTPAVLPGPRPPVVVLPGPRFPCPPPIGVIKADHRPQSLPLRLLPGPPGKKTGTGGQPTTGIPQLQVLNPQPLPPVHDGAISGFSPGPAPGSEN